MAASVAHKLSVTVAHKLSATVKNKPVTSFATTLGNLLKHVPQNLENPFSSRHPDYKTYSKGKDIPGAEGRILMINSSFRE
jgi:hypothetical protein